MGGEDYCGELKIMLMSLKNIYMRRELVGGAKRGDKRKEKLHFGDGAIAMRRGERMQNDEARLQSVGALHVSPCNTSLLLTPSPFPVLFCRVRSLLRLQPFATLDLAPNESQSNLKSTNQ